MILAVSGCGGSSPTQSVRSAPPTVAPAQPPTARASVPAATATPASSPSPAVSSSPTPVPLLGALPKGDLPSGTAAVLQAALDQMLAPDVVASVITPDGVWSGAAGIDGPNGRKATTADTFAIASVSKLIEAALIMRLVDEGKIDLDAPLQQYLGDVGVDTKGATVRQFLGMRSGFGDTPADVRSALLADCSKALTRDQVVTAIPSPGSPPGSSFQYSNPGYKLLGWAAEHVTGQSLAVALQREILEPAGVADGIRLQGPGVKVPKPWALPLEGHSGALELKDFGVGGALPCLADATLSLGVTGMAADMPSLARWGWELFAGRVVSPESLTEMVAPAKTGGDDYGLGVELMPGLTPAGIYGHSGEKDGYKAVLAVDPSTRTVIALAINDGNADEVVALTDILDALKTR
jgi:D-alanyl-D-alanine carboxypeptidase